MTTTPESRDREEFEAWWKNEWLQDNEPDPFKRIKEQWKYVWTASRQARNKIVLPKVSWAIGIRTSGNIGWIVPWNSREHFVPILKEPGGSPFKEWIQSFDIAEIRSLNSNADFVEVEE